MACCCVLALVLSPVLVFGRPPNQTKVQKSVLDGWKGRAENASEGQKSNLLAYLDSPAFRANISTIPMAKASSKDLMVWFEEHVRISPVMVTFNFTLAWEDIIKWGYVPNRWDLVNRHMAKFSHVQDYAETKLMKFPSFKNSTNPTIEEGWDRPTYFQLNIWRRSDGDPRYGDTNMVLNPKKRYDYLMAPCDTGWFTKMCLNISHAKGAPPPSVDCTAWKDHMFGTYESFKHLILNHQKFEQYPLSDLFMRFAGEKSAAGVEAYYEADLASSFWVPELLSFTIANFQHLFGKSKGEQLQQWHVKVKRPLVWTGDYSGMMVDAYVDNIAGVYKIAPQDKSDFQAMWKSGDGWFDTYNHDSSRRLHLHFLNTSQGLPSCEKCTFMGYNSYDEYVFWSE